MRIEAVSLISYTAAYDVPKVVRCRLYYIEIMTRLLIWVVYYLAYNGGGGGYMGE